MRASSSAQPTEEKKEEEEELLQHVRIIEPLVYSPMHQTS